MITKVDGQLEGDGDCAGCKAIDACFENRAGTFWQLCQTLNQIIHMPIMLQIKLDEKWQ